MYLRIFQTFVSSQRNNKVTFQLGQCSPFPFSPFSCVLVFQVHVDIIAGLVFLFGFIVLLGFFILEIVRITVLQEELVHFCEFFKYYMLIKRQVAS